MWKCEELVLFGHMEGRKEDWLVKRIVGSNVRGVRLRGSLRMGWLEGVKRTLNGGGRCVEQGRMIVCVCVYFSPMGVCLGAK